jgi:hypothetical protein
VVSVRLAVPSVLWRSVSVACATGLNAAIVRIQPGMVANGANALETNSSGIMIIIPANCATSGRPR